MSLATQMRRAAAGAGGAEFNPLSYGSPIHAYWAEDPSWSNPGDGNPVDSWPDAGSDGLTLTATGTARPTYRTSGINGKPAVDFDGSNHILVGTGGTVANDYTLVLAYKFDVTGDIYDVVVATWDGGSANTVIFREHNDGTLKLNANVDFNVAATVDTNQHIFVAEQQGGGVGYMRMKFDGSTVYDSSSYGEDTGANLYMGGLGSNKADCHVAFWAIYNSAVLSELWWNEFENGLLDYYGIA